MVFWHSNQNQLSGVGGWDFIEILVISLFNDEAFHSANVLVLCLKAYGCTFWISQLLKSEVQNPLNTINAHRSSCSRIWMDNRNPSHLCCCCPKRFSLNALGQAGCAHKRLSRRAVGKPVFLSLFYWVPWKTRLSLAFPTPLPLWENAGEPS